MDESDRPTRLRRRVFLDAAATTMLGTDAVTATSLPTPLGNGMWIASFRQAGYTDDQTFAAAFSYAAAQPSNRHHVAVWDRPTSAQPIKRSGPTASKAAFPY